MTEHINITYTQKQEYVIKDIRSRSQLLRLIFQLFSCAIRYRKFNIDVGGICEGRLRKHKPKPKTIIEFRSFSDYLIHKT